MNPSDTGDDTDSDPPTDVLPVSEPATRRPGPGLARRLVGLALIVLPLVLAALWAVVGPAPQPEEAGPTTGGPLRSALSDASANSSFTAAATGRLREGSAELADGAEEMRTGGQQLATGMDQLQAGMGEAGSGAQEVAGGVREVVGAVRGVAVIQGQVSTAIDDALGRLEGDEPGTVRAREALTGLRDQLAVQGMDQATLSDLDRLEGGADELARQLSAPGAELRDGIYEATRGSHELRDGAAALADGAAELRDGAVGVDDSATRTQDAVGRAGSALAVEQGDAGAAAADAAEDTQRRTSAGVLGVAAAAVLGALLVQLVRRPGSPVAESALALALLTAGLSAWALATAEAPSVLRSAAVVGVVGLVVVASTALWRALIAVAGPWPGRIVSAAVAAASIGAAWWVWVAGSAPSAVTTATSGSTTGQGTAALDSLLLAGPDPVVWAGAAVLLAVAVFSTLAARVAGPRP